ncbi:MAG: CDGSH iron-sulfur domain-containing protein [Methanobacteriota archaeon]
MVRIVQLNDIRPLVLKKQDLKGDVIEICRCGLSAQWPICDGTHKEARKEEPGKVYVYTRTVPDGKLVRQELAPAQTPPANPRPEGMEVA